MTERPIIFSGPMVKAILEGRKSQTRRIIKPRSKTRPSLFEPGQWSDGYVLDPGNKGWRERDLPYAVGDVLWVRENFIGARGYDALPPSKWGNKPIWFPADGEPDRKLWWHLSGKTRPSIHMPRWASRITLKVTGVKVERLNDISTLDARAEGIPEYGGEARRLGFDVEPENHFWDNRTTVENFAALWNSIHGPGAWDQNPWVAAISFERIDAAGKLIQEIENG